MFVSLADSRYGAYILNAAAALRPFSHHLLIVCMDAECMQLCRKHKIAAYGEVSRGWGGAARAPGGGEMSRHPPRGGACLRPRPLPPPSRRALARAWGG